LNCEKCEEWNFAYVLLQLDDGPVRLVVHTSMQMGGVESHPYSCVALETAGDVATQYIKKEVGSLPKHRCSEGSDIEATKDQSLHDFLDVYVNYFIPMARRM
jgi:hypothetical protein